MILVDFIFFLQFLLSLDPTHAVICNIVYNDTSLFMQYLYIYLYIYISIYLLASWWVVHTMGSSQQPLIVNDGSATRPLVCCYIAGTLSFENCHLHYVKAWWHCGKHLLMWTCHGYSASAAKPPSMMRPVGDEPLSPQPLGGVPPSLPPPPLPPSPPPLPAPPVILVYQ